MKNSELVALVVVILGVLAFGGFAVNQARLQSARELEVKEREQALKYSRVGCFCPDPPKSVTDGR